MGVINIVKEYPEVFGKVEVTIDEEDAWRIIASAKSHGSKIERVSFEVNIQFNAVSNLFQIGLRVEAVELAQELLKYSVKYQCHEIAQQLCKLLVDNSFLMLDIDSVHKYNLLYIQYSEIAKLEYKAKLIYGELLYNQNRGIETSEIEVIRSLDQIRDKLPFDSLTYHYFYHSCQIILASESEYEGRLQNAIGYFENLYYSHVQILSTFVIKLVLHYQKTGQYNEAKILINSHLKRCKEGSSVWFKYMKVACILYLSLGEMKRVKEYIEMALRSDKIQYLNDADKREWHQFRSAMN